MTQMPRQLLGEKAAFGKLYLSKRGKDFVCPAAQTPIRFRGLEKERR